MKSIADKIQLVRQRINNAQKKAPHSAREVTLLAISKTKPAAAVRQAWQAGLQHFGENYAQEAKKKMAELADLDLCWHFTGPIQTNKTKLIADGFAWVHTIDRLQVAERLAKQRPADQPPLNICIQLNINNEAGKAGINENQLPALATSIVSLPSLKLRGLMCIPDPSQTKQELHHTYATMRHLLNQLSASFPEMDTLSMGMSSDLEIAVAEGSTLVRVGTDIFGPRESTINQPQ